MKVKFQARVEKGALIFNNPQALRSHLWKFTPDAKLEVTIERKRRRRSEQQNRYYWGVVLHVISEETGNSTEELHEIYKRMFLPKQFIKYRGKDLPIPSSTPECNSAEFYEYIERIKAHAGEMGIIIPSPDEVEY